MKLNSFSILTFILCAAVLLVGKVKKSKTKDDHFLCGRNVGMFSFTMTILATQIGGGTIIGLSELAYQYGFLAIYGYLGIGFGFLALALGFGNKMRQSGAVTIPEILFLAYKSKFLQYLAAILQIISMFMITVGIAISTKKFLVSVGITSNVLLICIWITILAYTSFGGMKSVIKTDIMQIGFVIIVFTILMFTFMFNGVSTQALIPVKYTQYAQDASVIRWLLFPFLFTVIGQDMNQRCFAAKNANVVRYGGIIAFCVFVVISFIPIFFGVLAKKYIAVSNGSVLVNILQLLFGNGMLYTLGCVAILMAIMSTIDSLLCSISSNIVYDFCKNKDDKRLIHMSKISTFFIGILIIIVSFYGDNVISVIYSAYGVAVSALAVPIFAYVYFNAKSKLAAITSTITGLSAFAILEIFTKSQFKELLCISLSIVGFILGKLYDVRNTKKHK